MNLEIIMLSERSQSKADIVLSHLYVKPNEETKMTIK